MSTTATLLGEIADRIAAVSPKWAATIVTPTGPARTTGASLRDGLELGVETIYEGFLLHYGAPRVCSDAAGMSLRLLIGDFCYADGLRTIAATADIDAVETLAALIGDVATLTTEGATADELDARWSIALRDLSQ